MPSSLVQRDFLVGPEGDGRRLDAFLASCEGMPSRSGCARLIESGAVTINGTSATSKSESVLLGDRVAVTMPEPEPEPGQLRANPDIPLDIRYEDDYLMVLSKQAGLVCHPAPGHVDDTLANALVAHCGYGHLGLLQGEDRPGIVHRLDRDTSGLMVAAKDDAPQKALQDLIRLRVLERFEAGRRDEGYTLLECHLYTGRTHQIRVHMRHIGHPVIGDPLYGRGDVRQNLGLTRQFLHSWHIAFDHPVTGERIVRADTLPHDLLDILVGLRERSEGRTAAGDEICPQLGY